MGPLPPVACPIRLLSLNMNVSHKRGRSRTPRPAKYRKTTAYKRKPLPAVQRTSASELHSIDVPLTSVDADSTGSFNLLNGTIPGDNLQNRDSRKIQMRKALIRGVLRFDKAGTTPIDDVVRIILFYDRQSNGAAPAIADVLRNVDSAGTTTTSSLSAVQLANSARFLILRDEMWHMPITDATNAITGRLLGDVPSKGSSFKWFVKLPNLETHYNAGVAGTVADITTGALFLLVLGRSANADSQWGLTFESRVRFADG